ncbi:RNA-binding S4 domain-containing protein [Labilibaculum sp. A4]|jgi:ribosome-associated heat shock protein Hsp15|uniref:RNA-binding S4 domain-containing protein n=2 Tax=Labilibaculum TaxID=2060722 RepID=A0A425YCH8_9BACT|nr:MULTISPECIES: S4 domain-containing protein [Labilibaculum]MDQ1769675.1 S4 domain-containing protein [Labilibaculum euxinus]MUP36612.1 RNA-binding S4 domain-containing protein [Labilibaculum euxinus]MVB05817.1 RNA-binding S4 domain-containing protein [Labilibaculum euxinus]MWN76232.1 RNA-binding S4 domain-containing protein [Labilibaculum euxinus]PKQ69180.1 RNA-binding protein [Labilibaculum manganireducens]
MDDKVRVDKWLWAVRIFKTRSMAAEACKKGKVTIGGVHVKPSREVRLNEQIDVRVPPITRSYLVTAISGKRMGAKLAVDFVKDITAQDQLDLLEATNTRGFESRDRGIGRPTKLDRRLIDKLKKE